jgi:hypothetical protein
MIHDESLTGDELSFPIIAIPSLTFEETRGLIMKISAIFLRDLASL